MTRPDGAGSSGAVGSRGGQGRPSVPAQLEPPGPGKRLAENQAGPVVEGFEGLRVQVVHPVLLAAGLGRRCIRRPPSNGVLSEHAVQRCRARANLVCSGASLIELAPFLGLLTI